MSGNLVVALAGGVGAARFLSGVARVLTPNRIFIIGNTADDAEIHGLHVSPDLDTVTYTLAGLADPERGWGIHRDSFTCLKALQRLGAEIWFQLGDADLATHLYRTERLRAGASLSEVTVEISAALGVRSQIVPMSDHRVRTWVCTPTGELEFQTYFVKRRARDHVVSVRYEGAAEAQPARGVVEAIRNAEAIIICPSNPFISIGPILAVRGIREALQSRRDRVLAISPIVGGRALKGPAARMMKSMHLRPDAAEVARLYNDVIGSFVLDEIDESQSPRVAALDVRPVVMNTIMSSVRRREALARKAVRALGIRA